MEVPEPQWVPVGAVPRQYQPSVPPAPAAAQKRWSWPLLILCVVLGSAPVLFVVCTALVGAGSNEMDHASHGRSVQFGETFTYRSGVGLTVNIPRTYPSTSRGRITSTTSPSWGPTSKHSVPLGDGDGQAYGDVDHLLIGPPGLVSINTKHHRTGKLYLDGDQLVLNGHRTDYVPKARREADRVAGFLQATLAAHGHPELAGRVPVRSLLAIVGGRLMTDRWPSGVTVVMTSTLIEAVRAFPAALDPNEVAAVYELARRSTTWNPPPPPIAKVPAPRRPTAKSAQPRTPRPEHR